MGVRRTGLMISVAALTLVLASGVAFAAVIDGTPGDDSDLNGTRKSDTIRGFGGDDTLRGLESSDKLSGGAGDDLLRGMNGDDLLLGGAGRDEIYGQRGADRVVGGSGNDLIVVDLPSGDESDAVSCGYGDDTVYANRKDGVSKNCETVEIQ